MKDDGGQRAPVHKRKPCSDPDCGGVLPGQWLWYYCDECWRGIMGGRAQPAEKSTAGDKDERRPVPKTGC